MAKRSTTDDLSFTLSLLPREIEQAVSYSSRWERMEEWQRDDACQDWQDVVVMFEEVAGALRRGRLTPEQTEMLRGVMGAAESARPHLRTPEFDFPRIEIASDLMMAA